MLDFPPSGTYTDPAGGRWVFNGTYWIQISSGSTYYATGFEGGYLRKPGPIVAGVYSALGEVWFDTSASDASNSRVGIRFRAEQKTATGVLTSNELYVPAGPTGGGPSWNGFIVWTAANHGAGGGLDADLLDGLDLHAGRNNEANKVVRTNASGYALFGYINSNVGAEASAASHYWYMNGSDGYFRPKTLANVQAEVVTEAAIKSALANSADLQDTSELLLKQNCNIRASGGGAGTLYSTDIRDSTTAAAANMYIDPTGGFMQRSTSSRRYKKNIRPAKFGLVEVMKLRPVTYQGKSKRDGDKVHGGLIAEEVHAAGLPEFVVYRDGAPESLAYGNMVALLVKAVQEQQALIVSLQGQIDELRKRPA